MSEGGKIEKLRMRAKRRPTRMYKNRGWSLRRDLAKFGSRRPKGGIESDLGQLWIDAFREKSPIEERKCSALGESI